MSRFHVSIDVVDLDFSTLSTYIGISIIYSFRIILLPGQSFLLFERVYKDGTVFHEVRHSNPAFTML